MKNTRTKVFFLMGLWIGLVFQFAANDRVFSQGPLTRPATLKERAVFPKPDHTVVTERVQNAVIVVKFREGTRIRARAGQLRADLSHLTPSQAKLLQRANLNHWQIRQELNQINDLLRSHSHLQFDRMFTRPEADLDWEKQEGELNTGTELADLNLYYHVFTKNARPEEAEQLIEQLNTLDIVEIAYPQPVPEPATADSPATPDLTSYQRYLDAAPTGIDAGYAWTFAGGKGEGVRVIDVEGGWTLDHEDLNPVFYRGGSPSSDPGWKQHGTAVLGVIAAAENGYGVTGIAPRASLGVSSIFPSYCSSCAVNAAAAQLSAGDIILIELHARGPRSGEVCRCNCSQFEFIAMEYWPADYDAIRNATARGIIVVEAAGNGAMSFDAPVYEGRFDRSVRDSGAILVGAGTPRDGSPECFTNYGDRVDVHGWGSGVASLGYGDLWAGAGDRQWYTNRFSGTSSASPIIVGAAAAVQGVRQALGLPVLNSTEMRDLLSSTGTEPAPDYRQIGPLPNLRAAIDGLVP